MNQKRYFGYDAEKQKQYEQEARQQYGDREVNETNKRWKGYSKKKQEAIIAEGEAIFERILDNMQLGHDSPQVQAEIANLQKHFGYFFECTTERLRGLGQLYIENPDFRASFEAMDPDMPEFVNRAIRYYCDHNKQPSPPSV